MTNIRTRMLEDRYLRDSAKALVEADIDHLKNGLNQKSIAERTFDGIKEGATDIYEEAVELAEDNKGALAALLAAIIVWFARNPIMDLFGPDDEPDQAPSDSE